MKHEIQHNTIRVFYNQNGEWNRKFKLVYHKNKFLTPAIYELEKLLHTYKISNSRPIWEYWNKNPNLTYNKGTLLMEKYISFTVPSDSAISTVGQVLVLRDT